ncbi:cache domain-containing protein [Natronoarchaeum sp. GCM10025703]|uniref:PDC sensor domain-containing protein n=1 Tax=Natronoarchaeum sp. GCM10025703 TaxID=3252685 RepID=UPI0036090F03
MQLRRKFLLSLVLVAVVISGVMFVTFNSQRSAAIDEAQTDIDDRAGQTASTLDQRLRSNQQTLQVVADDPRLSDHGTDAQRTALETVQSLDGVGGVSVVDRDGEMVNLVTVTGGSPDTVIGQDYSDREYVTSALAGEEYISEPLRAATGNRIVVLSMPIYEGNDIVGTLNAALYLDGSFFQSAVGLRNISDTSVSVMSGTEALFQSEEQFDTTISGTATVQSTGWTVTVDHREGAVTEEIQRLRSCRSGRVSYCSPQSAGSDSGSIATTFGRRSGYRPGWSNSNSGGTISGSHSRGATNGRRSTRQLTGLRQHSPDGSRCCSY